MKPENLDKAIELKAKLNSIPKYEDSLIGKLNDHLIPLNKHQILLVAVSGSKSDVQKQLAEKYSEEITSVLNKYFEDKRNKFNAEAEKEKQLINKQLEAL